MLPFVVPGEAGHREESRDERQREEGTDSHLTSLASVSTSDDDNRPYAFWKCGVFLGPELGFELLYIIRGWCGS